MKKLFTVLSFALGLGFASAQHTTPQKVSPPPPPPSAMKVDAKKSSSNEPMSTKVAPPKSETEVKMKKDGTPDKRYNANKKLKKDGTPDKRYKK